MNRRAGRKLRTEPNTTRGNSTNRKDLQYEPKPNPITGIDGVCMQTASTEMTLHCTSIRARRSVAFGRYHVRDMTIRQRERPLFFMTRSIRLSDFGKENLAYS
jgi:hypothetical protein